MKRINLLRNRYMYALVAVVILQSAALVYLVLKTNTLNRDLNKAYEQNSMVMSELDEQKMLQRPAVLAKEKLIAFPEIGVTLPYNDVTKTLQYSYDGRDLRVFSTLISDFKLRQMSCLQMVRISMTDANPYSPWEELAGTVNLSDGKTMNIIAAKAFKNNEASTEECATEVWSMIKPSAVADEFKKAQTL